MMIARVLFAGLGMMGSSAWAAKTAPSDGVETIPVHEPVRLATSSVSPATDCGSCHAGESTQTFIPMDTRLFAVHLPSRSGWLNSPALPAALDLPETQFVAATVVAAQITDSPPPVNPLLIGGMIALMLIGGGIGAWKFLKPPAPYMNPDTNDPRDLALLDDDDYTTAKTDPKI